jgi:sugar/nucleoside kinase (ribokinase family)
MTQPIAVIGNANLDIVGGPLDTWPDRGTEVFLDRSDLRIGGSAANTALVLRRLGARAGLIAAAGADPIGAMIRAAFSGPLDRIAGIAGPSSVTFGVLHGDAERSFLSTRGHLDRFGPAEIAAALADWPLRGATALLSGSFAMGALRDATAGLLARLRGAGARVAIDPGWPGGGWTAPARAAMAAWLGLADIVLINDKELAGFAGGAEPEAARALLRPGATLIVKRGAAGAVSLSAAGTRHAAPAPVVDAQDTIGAGDAFNAGYLAALQRGAAPGDALARACRVASAVVAEFPRRDTPIALTEGAP